MLTALLLTACAAKVPLSVEEFTSRLEADGYTVEDYSYLYAELPDIESIIIVESDIFGMEFVVFSNSDYARQEFNEIKRDLDENREGTASISQVNTSSHNRFRITYQGQYSVVSRIENTVIFVFTSTEHRSAVDDILKLVGY